MALPLELIDVEADTDMVGDIDAFMRLYDAGYYATAYRNRMQQVQQEIERMYAVIERHPGIPSPIVEGFTQVGGIWFPPAN